MDSKNIYSDIKEKIIKIIKNTDCIIENIDNFSSNCSDALLLNKSTSYKNKAVDIKNSLKNQRIKLKEEVLKELESIN